MSRQGNPSNSTQCSLLEHAFDLDHHPRLPHTTYIVRGANYAGPLVRFIFVWPQRGTSLYSPSPQPSVLDVSAAAGGAGVSGGCG